MPEPAIVRLLPLGTGSILMGAGRSAAGYLLEANGLRILVDCGPGTLLRLDEAGVVPTTIDYVLLSHFHPDHHADLLGLLFHRQNRSHADAQRLTIVAPRGVRAILEAWRTVYGSWVEHPPEDVVEIDEGDFELGTVRARAFAAKHSPPAFCYRFDLGSGTTLAYSGDTEDCPGLVEACRGVDLCWMECSFPDDEHTPGHMTPARVRGVLEAAQPRVAALTHFYPPMQALLADEARWRALWGGLATRVIVLRDLEEVRP